MQALSAIHAGLPALPAPRHGTLHADTGLISPALIGRVAPALMRTSRSRGLERYYVGRRSRDTEVYIVTGTEVAPLEHPGYQSSAAFDWGDLSAGALELAFAMLADTTDSRPPDQICLAFRTEVVACLDGTGFVLGDGDIALWLLTPFCEDDGSYDSPPSDAPQSRRSRAVAWFCSQLRRR